jgi:uridine phosphorylase
MKPKRKHMQKRNVPILEYDAAKEAVVEPWKAVEQVAGMPKQGVLCFFGDVIEHLRSVGDLNLVAMLSSEIGENPVYRWDYRGQAVALIHPGVGAPLVAGFMEELIALGCSGFIACGGCGVLEASIGMGQVLLPIAAVRDEGTSYHYLPPSREVAPTRRALAALESALERNRLAYRRVKTWTTDGVYRETAARIERRKSEGCACVEMEAAALFAVARFRGCEIAQVVYGGDCLDGKCWDHRGWRANWPVREKLACIAADACLELAKHCHEAHAIG